MGKVKESCYNIEKYSVFTDNTDLLYSVRWSGKFLCKKDFFIDRKGVDMVVFLYTVKGCGELTINGEKFNLTKGKLAVIDCNEHITYYSKTDGWEFKFAHITGSNSRKVISKIIQKNSPVFNFLGEDIFDEILLASKNPNNLTIANLSCNLLTTALYSYENLENLNQIVYLSKKYIAENIDGDLSIENISKVLNVSRGYFTEVFTKTTKTPPATYVKNERLKHAKKLLISTNKPIVEIAELSGYKDGSSFIRFFESKTGKTPIKYRNEYKFTED